MEVEAISQEKLQQHVPYQNIGGHQDAVTELRYSIELQCHPEYSKLIHKFPQGILFYGPPGCGKTLLAKELSKTINGGFFTINGPELMSKYVGVAEERIREIFEEAKNYCTANNAASIIFIDEIDCVTPDRSTVESQHEIRFVSQLLALMQGVEDRGDIIVIGATNRPDAIDKALKRTGRFSKDIYIGPPNAEGRRDIFNIFMQKYDIKEIDPQFLENSIHITENFTGADIEGVFQQAEMICRKRCLPIVNGQFVKVAELIISEEDISNAMKVFVPTYKRNSSVVAQMPKSDGKVTPTDLMH